jgi:uncharacterized protein YkwD
LALAFGASGAGVQAEETSREAWLSIFNRERARIAALPLRHSPLLTEAAQEQAEEMAGAGRRLRSPSADAVSDLLLRVGYAAHDWREVFTLSAGHRPQERSPLRLALDHAYREVGVGTAFAAGFTLQVFLFATHQSDYFAGATAGLTDRFQVEAELLARINAVRRRAGLSPLAAHPLLDRASQRHADDMLERSYFGHRTPEGLGPSERAREEGYGSGTAENLVEGRLSAEEALRSWLDSPPHRRNILDPDCREIGLGLGLGSGSDPDPGAYRVVWVVSFGSGDESAREIRRRDPNVEVVRVVVRGGK